MDSLEEKIGYTFKRPEFLKEILIHPSYLKSKATSAFERAEFLGDRVLGMSIATLLYHHFPLEKEGQLAKKLAHLVCQDTLASLAKTLELAQHLTLAKEGSKENPQGNPSILADALEALLGAIYLEAGFETARSLIERLWMPLVASLSTKNWEDPKGQLQEWAQQKGLPLPQYTVLHTTGSAHAPTFTVEASCPPLPTVTAQGPSKKIAEQEAAAQLLTLIPRKIS